MTTTTLASPPATLRAADLGLLALLTLGWGANWPIMKVALEGFPLWTFRALCVIAGAVGLLGIALATRQRVALPRRHWPSFVAISFFNITAWNLGALYALTRLPSGRAAVIAYTMPLWAILLGRLVLGETIDRWRCLGLVLGMAGLSLLIAGDAASLAAAPVGAVLMLVAAISWAIGTVLLKRFPVPVPATTNVGWQMAIGGLPIVIGAILLDWGNLPVLAPGPVLATLYNMLVCFIYCYWAWTRLVLRLPVAVAGISTLLIPVVGTVSGMLMLGERPMPADFAGLALILAALVCVLILPQILARRRGRSSA
ncbi:DMT family transporter [Desertibaculum subflavum]|uniref:DMT family transporter n=1 Tax=Desertibaculum subflavum TaxID=2268458 RepID=UPI000E66CAD5